MAEKQSRSGRAIRIPLILIVLGGIIFAIWWFALRVPPIPASVVALSGRIESDDSAIAAKTAGRIKEIKVREGDQVKTGDIIATLDDDQVRAREQQAQAQVDQAEARVKRAQEQIAVLQTQVAQNERSVIQARLDAQGRVAQAESQVAAAEANLAQSQANYEQAKSDAERYTKLASTGDVSDQQRQKAVTTADAQAAAVRAAQKQVDAAKANVTMAKSNLENPPIREAQVSSTQQQIKQAQSDITAAQADEQRARAALKEAEANRSDLTILAPFDATVATRSAEPGEVVAPGTPIVTLVNYSLVYLRGFVPELYQGKIKVGQTARVYLDSAPKTPVDAYVSRVDPELSFTPENTYFRDDRVKQVVGVKLQIKNANGSAKPGMPADGEILVDGTTWPADTGRR